MEGETILHCTQGLTQLVLVYAPHPHPFANPLMQEYFVAFQIFKTGVIRIVPVFRRMCNDFCSQLKKSKYIQRETMRYIKFRNTTSPRDPQFSHKWHQKRTLYNERKAFRKYSKHFAQCRNCLYSAILKDCSRCRTVSYCSIKCQKTHWKKNHKYNCM